MDTKICINDALVKIDHKTLIIRREKGFFSISSSTMGGGMGRVNSIINYSIGQHDPALLKHGKEGKKHLSCLIRDKKVLEPAAAMINYFDIKNIVNVTTDDVTAIVTADYERTMSMNVIVLLNRELDDEILLKLFKAAVKAKAAALWDLGVINHFSFDPLNGEDHDSILVAGTGQGEVRSREDVLKLQRMAENCVREAAGKALRSCGFPKDVLKFMEDVGVKVEDLVDAGMELCVGVERSEELHIKLQNQILKSLKDLNVVSLIIAGIRLEEDYEKHRVRGVNVDDDPAYLYSDEIMGMAIANQIAGTKAIFNFKRYDEAKPGIISTLGPVLDDIFAGVVAGCMSKIFEE
jgi:alpha-ribazole phosphatase CobZ